MAIFNIIAEKAQNNSPSSTASNHSKSAITHNLFVLIVQYKILNERIKEMGTG
jgi:hypothetical protein